MLECKVSTAAWGSELRESLPFDQELTLHPQLRYTALALLVLPLACSEDAPSAEYIPLKDTDRGATDDDATDDDPTDDVTEADAEDEKASDGSSDGAESDPTDAAAGSDADAQEDPTSPATLQPADSNICGKCASGMVCCTEFMCAGMCVPDCRNQASCPDGLLCNDSSGVCEPADMAGPAGSMMPPPDGTTTDMMPPPDGTTTDMMPPPDGTMTDMMPPPDGTTTDMMPPPDGTMTDMMPPPDGTTTDTMPQDPPPDEDCAQAAEFADVSSGSAGSGYASPVMTVSCTTETVSVESNGIPNFELPPENTWPNVTAEIDATYTFPRFPKAASSVSPVPLQDAIGVTVIGMPIFGPTEAGIHNYKDPNLDDMIYLYCGGHPSGQGQFHFHAIPTCLTRTVGTETFLVLGYAWDGYPILAHHDCAGGECGPSAYYTSSWQRIEAYFDAEGRPDYTDTTEGSWDIHEYVEGSGDLDECNGGDFGDGYAYHVTDTFPYFLGCYHGTPTSNGGPQMGGGGMMMPPPP